MNNPLQNLIEKHAGAGLVPRARQFLAGLAEDFWADAPLDPAQFDWLPAGLKKHLFGDRPAAPAAPAPPNKKAAPAKAVAPAATPQPKAPPWRAAPGEVAETMWGAGYVLPAGEAVGDLLTKPLGLKADSNLLDLTAGLGGGLRRFAGKVGLLKGLEPDAALAARGMDLSAKAGKAKQAPVEAYDTATFAVPPTYDAAIARELFYRVADKPAFFMAIADGLKQGAQIAFTDYIVDPENREKPAILQWQAHEKGAAPLGLIEMAQAWAKAGFEMRASEDETPLYMREGIGGLQRLVAFLAGHKPDRATKQEILREVELWVYRMAAMEQGMKFYRFHAVRQG